MGSVLPRYKWTSFQGLIASIYIFLIVKALGLGAITLVESMQAIPASLGVSATRQYHVNSLAVPRKAKEAIGGIARLTHADGM